MRHMPSLRKRVGVALASSILVLAAAGSAAAWSTTTTVSTAALQAANFQIVANAKGATAMTWVQNHSGTWDFKVRVKSAGGTWSSIRSVASNMYPGGWVAIDAAGNTYLAWLSPESVDDALFAEGHVRVLTAAGSLGAVTSFPFASNGAGFNLSGITAGPSGGYLYGVGTEASNTGQTEVRRIYATGHVGPIEYLSDPAVSPNDALEVSAAVDASGRLTAAWTDGDADTLMGVVKARQLGADGTTLGPIQQISTTAVPAGFPQVAVPPSSGNGIVGWYENSRTRFRRFNAAGTFSSSATSVNSGQSALAINNSGVVAATWLSSGVVIRTVSPTGVAGVVHRLVSTTNYNVQSFETALDASGRTLTMMCIGTCDFPAGSTKLRIVPYGGSPGTLATLSTSSHGAGVGVAFVPNLNKFRIMWNSGATGVFTKVGP